MRGLLSPAGMSRAIGASRRANTLRERHRLNRPPPGQTLGCRLGPSRRKFEVQDGALASSRGSKKSPNATCVATNLNATVVNRDYVCLN